MATMTKRHDGSARPVVNCNHGSGRRSARRGQSGPASPDAPCKEEALAISRTAIPQGSGGAVRRESVGIDAGPGKRLGATRAMVRSLGMLALAALGILVLLPAALAAQAVAF